MQIDLPDGFLVAAVLFYYDHESIKENDYEDTIPPFIYSDNGVSVRSCRCLLQFIICRQ